MKLWAPLVKKYLYLSAARIAPRSEDGPTIRGCEVVSARESQIQTRWKFHTVSQIDRLCRDQARTFSARRYDPRDHMAEISKPLQLNLVRDQLTDRRQRDGLSLRRAAEQSGVSFNTLARVEKGRIPDLLTLQRLLAWLGLSLADLVKPGATRERSTPEEIGYLLRTDPALPVDAADHIAQVVNDLYRALISRDKVTAMHLHGARTFLPAAATKLSAMLTSMEAVLVQTTG